MSNYVFLGEQQFTCLELLEAIDDAGPEGLVISPEMRGGLDFAIRRGWVLRHVENETTGLRAGARWRWTLSPAGKVMLEGGNPVVVPEPVLDAETVTDEMAEKRAALRPRSTVEPA